MTHQTMHSAELDRPRSVAVAGATIAALLGVFLIMGVGFASPESVHNAVHDTRHALSFPCH